MNVSRLRLIQSACMLAACLGLTPAAHAQDIYGQNGYQTLADGTPLLESLPGAAGVLFLDFDGAYYLGPNNSDYQSGWFPAPGWKEQVVYNAWHDVATQFAMFDINVTTIQPDKSTTPASHIVITPDLSNASGPWNTFGDGRADDTANAGANKNYARTRSATLSHELGHTLGLLHHSYLDEQGNYLSAYRPMDEYGRGSIMGRDNPVGSKFVMWSTGYHQSYDNYNDDIATITGKLISEYSTWTGGTYTGDGFRPDAEADTYAQADADLLLDVDFLATNQYGKAKRNARNNADSLVVDITTSGFIERYDDVDMFAFDWNWGEVTVTAESIFTLADQSEPEYSSSLGMNLALYDSAGVLVAEDLSLGFADVDATLTTMIKHPGTFYAVVTSGGEYEDLGTYTLSINGTTLVPGTTSAAAAAVPEPGALATFALLGLCVLCRRRQ